MALDIVPAEPLIDQPDPSAPPQTEEGDSLTAHEASLKPARDEDEDGEAERPAANTGQFANKAPDAKRKASSQRATPEDVAEINALTRELRETEQRLADKDPDATASPRIRTLRRQIAALKAIEAPKDEPKASTPAAVTSPPAPVSTAPTFTDKMPVLEDFADEPDPYAAFVEAKVFYKLAKQNAERQAEAATTAASQRESQQIESYNQRVSAFVKEQPDFPQVTAQLMSQELPALLRWAIVRDDNAAQYVYYLAQHPDLVDELFLLTDGKEVSDASVATVQRRVRQHALAAQATGSATVARTTFVPPRPPNPVRTGPIRTGSELPGDESSLAEHEKAFSQRRRRQ